VNFGIVTFPGSNCDHDCFHVAKKVLGQETTYLWHKDRDLKNIDCLIIPGGFSFGDYLRTGAVAKFSPIMEEIVQFAKKGGPVIGICNGFQILLEVGLLSGAMLKNKNLNFICKNVFLKVERTDTPFTTALKGKSVIQVPIAHGEGNYYADDDTLERVEGEGCVLFRYADANGRVIEEVNPNGSRNNIAGIVNFDGNVLGMMPHPERCAEAILGNRDGEGILRSLVEHALENVNV